MKKQLTPVFCDYLIGIIQSASGSRYTEEQILETANRLDLEERYAELSGKCIGECTDEEKLIVAVSILTIPYET